MRKPRVKGVNVTICVAPEIFEQMEALCRVLHVSRTAIVSQAIARWFHAEPLMQREQKEAKRKHGNNHVGV